MGKVGSSTVYDSLKSYFPYNNIFHVHFLSENYLKHILPKKNHGWNIEHGQKILEYIQNNPNKRIKIITLVREPVSREISNFFQNEIDYINEPIEEYSKSELLKIFQEKVNFSYTLTWFDEEFHKFTNLDIYSYQFDCDNGYSILKEENFDILAIKLEKLDHIIQEAIRRFLGINLKRKFIKSNETNIKPFKSDFNRHFKENFKLTHSKLLDIYQSKFCQHFYTTDEIDYYINKWRK